MRRGRGDNVKNGRLNVTMIVDVREREKRNEETDTKRRKKRKTVIQKHL